MGGNFFENTSMGKNHYLIIEWEVRVSRMGLLRSGPRGWTKCRGKNILSGEKRWGGGITDFLEEYLSL